MTHPEEIVSVTRWITWEHWNNDTEEFETSDCDQFCWHQDDMEALIESIQEDALYLFPSFDKTDSWEHREINIVAQNTFAKLGVSEYCGMLHIALIPVTDSDNWIHTSEQLYNLGSHWIKQVSQKFLDNYSNYFKD